MAPRRLALLKWARSGGAWVVEDDYDSYFRYGTRPVSGLQASIAQWSTSRHLRRHVQQDAFPSLRLGFCIVPAGLVDTLVEARAVADRHSPVVDQAVLTTFITEGHYERHLRRIRLDL